MKIQPTPFFAVAVCLFGATLFAQVTEVGPLIPPIDRVGIAEKAGVADLFWSSAKLTSAEIHDLGALSSMERQRLTKKVSTISRISPRVIT